MSRAFNVASKRTALWFKSAALHCRTERCCNGLATVLVAQSHERAVHHATARRSTAGGRGTQSDRRTEATVRCRGLPAPPAARHVSVFHVARCVPGVTLRAATCAAPQTPLLSTAAAAALVYAALYQWQSMQRTASNARASSCVAACLAVCVWSGRRTSRAMDTPPLTQHAHAAELLARAGAMRMHAYSQRHADVTRAVEVRGRPLRCVRLSRDL